MKKFYLFGILLVLFFFTVKAQEDTVRSLIITEWRTDAWSNFYCELTNVGEDTLDLSRFTFITVAQGQAWPNFNARLRLWGTLDPGESWVMMATYDAPDGAGRPVHKTQMIPIAKESGLIVHQSETGSYVFPYNPANEMWGKDSIDSYNMITRYWSGTYASGIYYHLDSGIDSVLVDAVNNAPVGTNHSLEPHSVAGIEGATLNCLLLRKATVKQGNLNWDQARGVDLSTSEWLPVPHGGTNHDGDIFTTVGNHGDYHISITSGTVTVNINDAKLTVPWGTQKRDSLVRLLTLGKGMTWNYIEDTVDFADSAHTICQDGDILNMYAIGNTLEEVDFKISVNPPTDNMVEVFPLRTLNYPTPEEAALGAEPEWGGARYYVTEKNPVIDTIGNVPFATRVDTLMKYLEWAPNATAQVIWKDEKERVDLMNGDLLRITGGNGTSIKNYYIDVQPYELNSNALLSAIIWPDKTEYMDGWAEDTIPGFNSTFKYYEITMPYGTTNVPALVAIPQDINAKISVKRAISLSGGQEAQTTTFEVTAEDDTTVNIIKVLFKIDLPTTMIQKYQPDPFISELVLHQSNWNCFIEIMNSGNTTMDLSRYMVVNGMGIENPALAIQEIVTLNGLTNFTNRLQRAYVPGFKFSGDTVQWQLAPGKLYYDPVVNPIVEPGDVFVIAQAHHVPTRLSPQLNQADVILSPALNNSWGEKNIHTRSVPNIMVTNNSTVFLFEILNDSILEGTKEIQDPNDFKLIDIIGSPAVDNWEIAGRIFTPLVTQLARMERKPFVYKGVTNLGEGFGTDADNSDWFFNLNTDFGWDNNKLSENVGTHFMDPVTLYKSTVSSLVYISDDGFEGKLYVNGIGNGETVEQFFGNLIKADAGQVLKVMSTVNGSLKNLTDKVAANDTLVVTSANLENVTKYILLTTPLDNNAALTAASGSGLTITIDGANGTVSGFNFGTSIDDVLQGVVKPAKAILNVVNASGELVTLNSVKTDSTKTEAMASENVYFEVKAQDGVTKITYQLIPVASESDAYVLSDIYTVLQDSSAVTGIIFGTSVVTFFKNIIVVDGATAIIIDKAGDERTMGNLSYDDLLAVTSGDKSTVKVYYLQFYDEPAGLEQKLRGIPEAPDALTLVNVSSTGTEATIQWTDKSDFETGFIVSRNGTVIDTVESNTFIYQGLLFATEYEFGVYAFNELGNSNTATLVVLTYPTSVNTRMSKIGVYPSITTGFVRITGLSKSFRIEVRDNLGRVIIQKSTEGEEQVLNLQTYPAGMYIVSVIDQDGKMISTKIIKE